MTAGRRAVCSFSGGKDSCLALWRARQLGLDVRALLVMFDETGERSRSHAIPPQLVERQAASIGGDLLTRSASWRDYEQVFTAALAELARDGYEVAVFGDIDLEAHRAWEEKVCAAAGLETSLPLWGSDRTALAREVLHAGFRARVVCVDRRYLPAEACGREYDESFIRDLPEGVDACGENGEFHTFVYDGPIFSEPVGFSIDGSSDVVAPPEYGAVPYRFARLG